MTDWKELTAAIQETSTEVFGTAALYRVAGAGAGVSISGIFRDASIDAEVGLEVGGGTVAPVIHVREIDLPAGALETEDDTIELTDATFYPEHIGLQYRVRDNGPDGEGMLELLLVLEG